MRRLIGDSTVQPRNEAAPPSLMDRVNAQLDTTSLITETARSDCEIAPAGFEKLLEEMRGLIEVDLRKLKDALEAAGAPRTPGRNLPRWENGT